MKLKHLKALCKTLEDYENITPEIIVRGTLTSNSALVYFKSKEAAQETIGILGYTEIIYALSYI